MDRRLCVSCIFSVAMVLLCLGDAEAADPKTIHSTIGATVSTPNRALDRDDVYISTRYPKGSYILKVTVLTGETMTMKVEEATTSVCFGVMENTQGVVSYKSMDEAIAVVNSLVASLPMLKDAWAEKLPLLRANKADRFQVNLYHAGEHQTISVTIGTIFKGIWHVNFEASFKRTSDYMRNAVAKNLGDSVAPPTATAAAEPDAWDFSRAGDQLLVADGTALNVLALPDLSVQTTFDTGKPILRLWALDDGKHVELAHEDSVSIWSLATGKRVVDMPLTPGMEVLDISDRGNIIVVKTRDAFLCVQLPKLVVLRTISNRQAQRVVDLSPDGRHVLVHMTVGDLYKTHALTTYTDDPPVSICDALRFGPRFIGGEVWYNDAEGKVHVVDPKTGKDLRALNAPKSLDVDASSEAKLQVAFLPGEAAAVGVVSDFTGKHLYQLGVFSYCKGMHLSPDGRYVVCHDNFVKKILVWDLTKTPRLKAD